MDIKAKIEEVAKKIMADKDILEKFQKDPVSVVEELIGVDLPNDQLQPVVDMVKAEVTIENVGNILDSLGNLFGKK